MHVKSGQPAFSTSATASLFHQTPASSLLVSVVVPVRNEAAHLVDTLNALKDQQDMDGMPFGHHIYEVLLLANNCSDNSYKIVKDYQLAHPGFALHVAEVRLPAEKANIGTARRLLMDAAYHRFMLLGRNDGIIASTDGDTEVDSRWICHIIHEIQKGNDAVGGRIVVGCRNGQPGKYHLLDETYRNLVAKVESILDPLEHDPWPRHFQYFGASLAVTCDMYQRAGRLPQLPYLEDEAFYKALLRKDAKIRKSPVVKVITSGRHEGKVSIGLSEQLKKWAQMETKLQPQMVAGAGEIIARFTHRHTVRMCRNEAAEYGTFNTARLLSVAHELQLPLRWLRYEMESSLYFGQLWETVEQRLHANGWCGKWKPEKIEKAISALKEFIDLCN